MIRAAFAHLVRAVAGTLARWARKIEGRPFTGNEFGKEFCLALGLNPSGTGDITLHVPVEGAVTATVEKIFKGVNSDGLLELMTHASEYVTYVPSVSAPSPCKIDKNQSRILLEAMQKVAPRCIGFSHSFAGSAGRVIESGTRCACGALIYGEDLGDITHVEAHTRLQEDGEQARRPLNEVEQEEWERDLSDEERAELEFYER